MAAFQDGELVSVTRKHVCGRTPETVPVAEFLRVEYKGRYEAGRNGSVG